MVLCALEGAVPTLENSMVDHKNLIRPVSPENATGVDSLGIQVRTQSHEYRQGEGFH